MTLVAAFIGPASSPFGIPDGLWSLLRGRWMAEHGTLLHADPFTSAPHVDGPMLNVQWLADLCLRRESSPGGLEMVIVWVALAVTLTTALLLLAAYSASPHLRLSCVAVWASYVLGATNFSPRPQTLAYPLFALFVLAVARAEWHRDTRGPVAAAVRHGPLGEHPRLLLPGVRAAGLRRSWVASSPRVSFSPRAPTCSHCSRVCWRAWSTRTGRARLVYVASIGSNPVIRDYVTEWAPTTVSQREGILFFASLVVLGGLALKSRMRLTPLEMLSAGRLATWRGRQCARCVVGPGRWRPSSRDCSAAACPAISRKAAIDRW